MFASFWGNRAVAESLRNSIQSERLAQTLLFAGPEGVGKATLARRFAAELLGAPEKIEADDQSLEANLEIVAGREKWPAEKRNDDPLFFASHPDFLTFPPDGPLRQIGIPQMRLLKEMAGYQPSKGNWRVFLIDHVDRANDQAANSLLKILEEPPPHLIVILTAENAYDLLPTIRSRSIQYQFAPLGSEELEAVLAAKGADSVARRTALAAGSPGLALTLDLEAYDRRRVHMLAFLEAASGVSPFSSWTPSAEAISRSRNEKLEFYLKVLYLLLRDVLLLREGGGEIKNRDVQRQLAAIAARVSFAWIRAAVGEVDELARLLRRNIQKSIALDAVLIKLRQLASARVA